MARLNLVRLFWILPLYLKSHLSLWQRITLQTLLPAIFIDFHNLCHGHWVTLKCHPRRSRHALTSESVLPHMIRLIICRFHQHYLQHAPIFEGTIDAIHCYEQSLELFWIIVATGARRHRADPTLLTSLSPHVADLARKAAFSHTNRMNAVQILILLCSWPLPLNSLTKDISPMLAGAMIQHALAIGLHVHGIGQDFTRVPQVPDPGQIAYRARLWCLCAVVFQRYVIDRLASRSFD